MKQILRAAAVPLLLVFLGASIFGRLVWNDPILQRDDAHVLANLHHPTEWLFHLSRLDLGWLIGVSPVRDLTLLLDRWLTQSLGFGTFHFTNALIWFVLAALVHRILRFLSKASSRRNGPDFVPVLTLLFALHPVMVGSVAWISARKHLLAALWILAATDLSLRRVHERRTSAVGAAAILIFYFLSVLSQPIAILWPLWAILLCWVSGREQGLKTHEALWSRVSAPFLACVPFLAVGAVFALRFYSKTYVEYVGNAKLLSDPDAGLSTGIWALALGRYVFNGFIPVRVAAVYYPGSPWNLLGLGLGCLLGFFSRRAIGGKESLLWLSFWLIPLAPVTFLATNVFASDTYELISLAGLAVLVLRLLEAWEERSARFEEASVRFLLVPALSGLLVALFVLADWPLARAWASDGALWKHSYVVEPSPRSLYLHARYLLEERKVGEALPLVNLLKEWDSGSDWKYLSARATYLNPELTDEQKISALETQPGMQPGIQDAWAAYYGAALHAARGEFGAAFTAVHVSLDSPARFGEDWPGVVAEAVYFCRRAGPETAANGACDEVAERARRSPGWAEAGFSQRLAELEGSANLAR